MNTLTRQLEASVPMGFLANTVALDSLTNLIFVTDGQGNQVFVVDGRTNTIRATVPLNGVFPSGIAANSVTRFVYVTEFDSAQVEILTER